MRGKEYLYPPLKEKAEQLEALCELMGLPVLITDTLRTQEEQEILYAKGRTAPGSIVTNAKYSLSPHCWGLAFDFCKDHCNKAYDDSDNFFLKVGTLGKLLGLTWGGNFQSFIDKPHLEYAPLLPNNSVKMIREKYDNPEKFMSTWQKDTCASTYEYNGGIHFVRIPIDNFKILMWDKSKRTTEIKNYGNGGFFGEYNEGTTHFTLPAANLVADLGEIGSYPTRYLQEWGRIKNGKVYVDCKSTGAKEFKNKAVSTLVLNAAGAKIKRYTTLPDDTLYAVSGIPVIRKGTDVSYKQDVLAEGWTEDSLYGTWHGFLAVDGRHIVYMAMQTTTDNCIASSEVYRKLSKYGFQDVIKLDGGGSFILDVAGKNRAVTTGKRQINNVIMF